MVGVPMPQQNKIQYFESEGRDHLTSVLKSIKAYLRQLVVKRPSTPKVIFFTRQGEGPMLAYNELSGLDVTIIAVTFPPTFSIRLSDDQLFTPTIPEKVEKFFKGVEIPVIRARLPFDDIHGADAHNRDLKLIQDSLSIFGGSFPLAIQAVLQATDAGLVSPGEEVVAATADTALVITASTTKLFLSKSSGLAVNEIICKPRNLTMTRPKPVKLENPEPEIQLPSRTGVQRESTSPSTLDNSGASSTGNY